MQNKKINKWIIWSWNSIKQQAFCYPRCRSFSLVMENKVSNLCKSRAYSYCRLISIIMLILSIIYIRNYYLQTEFWQPAPKRNTYMIRSWFIANFFQPPIRKTKCFYWRLWKYVQQSHNSTLRSLPQCHGKRAKMHVLSITNYHM